MNYHSIDWLCQLMQLQTLENNFGTILSDAKLNRLYHTGAGKVTDYWFVTFVNFHNIYHIKGTIHKMCLTIILTESIEKQSFQKHKSIAEKFINIFQLAIYFVSLRQVFADADRPFRLCGTLSVEGSNRQNKINK